MTVVIVASIGEHQLSWKRFCENLKTLRQFNLITACRSLNHKTQ